MTTALLTWLACSQAGPQPVPVEVRIVGGRFQGTAVHLRPHQNLLFKNEDAETYTIEAPGLFPGDATVAPKGRSVVEPLPDSGKFEAMIEEIPSSTLIIESDGVADSDLAPLDPPFDVAKQKDRQPLLFRPGRDPAYGCFTAFNLTVKGQEARQKLLRDLYRVQEELADDQPPPELSLYFKGSGWAKLRTTVGMVVGLGPGAFDRKGFGERVAESKPAHFHPVAYAPRIGIKSDAGQRDVLIRITSESYWFNLRACRLVWDRCHGRIASPTLEPGYAPPAGRSPILGGFFDGVGNPSEADRERAVYGAGRDDTFLALFRVAFDEARFRALPVKKQEAVVGRRLQSGHLMPGAPSTAHRVRAQNDNHSLIVRMPLVFEDGVGSTGLLFCSAQASIDSQLERILKGFMLRPNPAGKKDSLLSFMRFEEAAYYYVPASPRGSYPGSLRNSEGPRAQP